MIIKSQLLKKIKPTDDINTEIIFSIESSNLNEKDVIHFYWENNLIAGWKYSNVTYPVRLKDIYFISDVSDSKTEYKNPSQEPELKKRKKTIDNTSTNIGDLTIEDLKKKEQRLFKEWLEVHNTILNS
jgi:hypothetical protein